MSDYLLDTNILILALRGHSRALDFLLALEREEKRAFISVVTRAEVLAGMPLMRNREPWNCSMPWGTCR